VKRVDISIVVGPRDRVSTWRYVEFFTANIRIGMSFLQRMDAG
jgi:hypothetical protein